MGSIKQWLCDHNLHWWEFVMDCRKGRGEAYEQCAWCGKRMDDD